MSEAPYGVIFNDKRVIVGVPHGKKIPMSPDIEQRIRVIGDNYGYWYEGNGGDKKLFTASYKGSWDDKMSEGISGYPSEFLSAMFSNADISKQIRMITNVGKTIFDSIMDHNAELSPLKDKEFSQTTLATYLDNISDSDVDFISMSERIATRGNTEKFFKAGVAKTFPTNWTEFPYKAGKIMKKVIDRRNKFILSQDRGVYFIGAGHLLNMKKLDPNLNIIGGEKAE